MLNATGIIMSTATLIIYTSTCFLCLLLAFFREKYLEIESAVDMDIFRGPSLSPILEVNINWLHDWLLLHNRPIGVIFAFLSVVDIKLSFWVISRIS